MGDPFPTDMQATGARGRTSPTARSFQSFDGGVFNQRLRARQTSSMNAITPSLSSMRQGGRITLLTQSGFSDPRAAPCQGFCGSFLVAGLVAGSCERGALRLKPPAGLGSDIQDDGKVPCFKDPSKRSR
jgi:hypothetical protein